MRGKHLFIELIAIFALSRKKSESIFIDEFEVIVDWIRYKKIQLIFSVDDEIVPLEDILYKNTKIEISDEISIIAVLITEDKVRLGIEAPRGTHFDRYQSPES